MQTRVCFSLLNSNITSNNNKRVITVTIELMSAAAGLASFLFRSSSLPLLVVALISFLFTCLSFYSRPAGFLLFWRLRGVGGGVGGVGGTSSPRLSLSVS